MAATVRTISILLLTACTAPTEPKPAVKLAVCESMKRDTTNVKFVALIECKSRIDTLTIP